MRAFVPLISMALDLCMPQACSAKGGGGGGENQCSHVYCRISTIHGHELDTNVLNNNANSGGNTGGAVPYNGNSGDWCRKGTWTSCESANVCTDHIGCECPCPESGCAIGGDFPCSPEWLAWMRALLSHFILASSRLIQLCHIMCLLMYRLYYRDSVWRTPPPNDITALA